MIHIIDNYYLDNDEICWMLKRKLDPNPKRKKESSEYRVVGYYTDLRHLCERLIQAGIMNLGSFGEIIEKLGVLSDKITDLSGVHLAGSDD